MRGRDILAASLVAACVASAAHADETGFTPDLQYEALGRVFLEYLAIDERGGWPRMPEVLLTRSVDAPDAPRDPEAKALAMLCERLTMTGDLAPGAGACAADAPRVVYDAELEAAVRRFQARHGLDVDGIVGPRTRAALNVPARERAEQLAINMLRWHTLPADLGDTYVLVNIPGFFLRAVRPDGSPLSMKVVVGKPATPTPAFSDAIRYLVFRPYWNVPDSITQRELLPRIANDPEYFHRQRLEVVDGWQSPGTVLDPATIDWDEDPFPYRLRQRPGGQNSLGLVKFMFPNEYNVYLHDTPARHLFDAATRAFSHGCVRVERPVALADYLLHEGPGWSRPVISAAMQSGGRQVVRLTRPVAVYLTYFTAWVDDNGTVNFRADIYNRDAWPT